MDFGMSREELLNSLGLVGREVVGNEMNLLTARLIGHHLGEEGHWLVWRAAVLPTTSPLRVLSAAYSERVPWR